MTGSIKEALKKTRNGEQEVRDIEEEISSLLSGDVSEDDLQTAAQKEKKASELINQITGKLQQIIQKGATSDIREVEESVERVEEEIRAEIENSGGFQNRLNEVRKTLSRVEKVLEVISIAVETVEGAENTVTLLEKEELELLSEVEELAVDAEATGGNSNVRNAAQHILATDKAAASGTIQVFRAGRELAESLTDAIEELESGLTKLEANLNNMQTGLSDQHKKQEIRELIAEIDKLRARLDEQEKEIRSIDWDEIENESLSLKERIEKQRTWEGLTGGMTNEVRSRGDDVIKKFKRSKTQLFQALGNVPSGEFQVPTVEMRIQNERRFRQIYGWMQENNEEIPVDLPKILEQEGNIVRVEKIEGTPLNKYLNSTNSGQEQKELGRKVGLFTRKIHENEIAITDFRINNFVVKKDGNLSIVDVEYASLDASGWQKNYMDLITLVSSARQLNPDAYQNFMQGFKSEYGEVGVLQKAIAAVLSKGHAAALEKDRKRTTNALRNTAVFFKSWV